ncbi:DUF4815 domain-containing protein [Pseudovibrio sp. Tun.PSC04-5.I4]|uniref:DUF4815 domain-containing protein n=1 Tax=Pseudovibrio sp. Tun.PSC04-5.I4 TaxID=1798213 RepID=UPI00088A37B3|nr:DUF4815 domain-containing protein [Pseudovibrio sp. Tun.PSC04-5.I4]SDQ99848.1 protein of unknown function [Pseudovibrio sp. Tun.PSC04-5.I4]
MLSFQELLAKFGLTDIYSRYDRSKGYQRLLHHKRQFVESAEANETQQIFEARIGDVGTMLVGASSLREGGAVVVQSLGQVLVEAARIWIESALLSVPEKQLIVPTVGLAVIGVYLDEQIITDQDDPSLKGIVSNTASAGQSLAARLVYPLTWGVEGDGTEGTFYPVHTLLDGQVQNVIEPPSGDVAEQLVARHVRQTHGSHVIKGFDVSYGGKAGDDHRLLISAGELRANGILVTRTVDSQLLEAETPELSLVRTENHAYVDRGDGKCEITTNRAPIDEIVEVTLIAPMSKTITHGVAGGIDSIGVASIYAVTSIKQGGTTYVEGADFTRSGDNLDWSLPGAEPAPGSSLDLELEYSTQVVPETVSAEGYVIAGGVAGRNVTTRYKWKLSRTDILAINQDGAFVYLKGLSTGFNPLSPSVPEDLCPLVRLHNRWGQAPVIEAIGLKAIKEAEARATQRDLLVLAEQVSTLQLRQQSADRDPASHKGYFTDNCTDRSQVDDGLNPTAVVTGGFVRLPLAVSKHELELAEGWYTLPHLAEVIEQQPFRTAITKINPYMAFDPVPAALQLDPPEHYWSEVEVETTQAQTVRMVAWNASAGSQSLEERISTSQREAEFIPQITITYRAEDFGPGEQVASLTFDGIAIAENAVADAQGVVAGSFNVPANIPTGQKRVEIKGQGSSEASAVFISQGTITTEQWRVTTVLLRPAAQPRRRDPVSQSFVLPEDRLLLGVDVEFTARGDASKGIACEVRAAPQDTPEGNVFASGSIAGDFALSNPNADLESNWSRIAYQLPLPVPAGERRAFALLTDDPDHAIAYAQLGSQVGDSPKGFDARKQQWVRKNPVGGQMATSPNNAGWVLHPDSDVTYRLIGARFTATEHRIEAGAIALSNASDLVAVLSHELMGPQTKVVVELSKDGDVIRLEPNTYVELDRYLNGNWQVAILLYGTPTRTPLIAGRLLVLAGTLQETAEYISQAITLDVAGGPLKVRSMFEVSTPGSSSVSHALGGDGDWHDLAPTSHLAKGDGWTQREHLLASTSDLETRLKLTLSGTPASRPRVRGITARATEV